METVDKILAIINHIRPYINADGGDLEFVSYENHIVTVKFLGACAGCTQQDVTLNDGIKQWLMDEIDEIEDVVIDQGSLFDLDDYNAFEGFDY